MSTYVRHSYVMRTVTLTVPAVDNFGTEAPWHLDKVRAGLAAAGFTGWTEVASTGYWMGKLEPGTVVTLYVERPTVEMIDQIGQIGRQAMPDQEAVQVTLSHDPVSLYEA